MVDINIKTVDTKMYLSNTKRNNNDLIKRTIQINQLTKKIEKILFELGVTQCQVDIEKSQKVVDAKFILEGQELSISCRSSETLFENFLVETAFCDGVGSAYLMNETSKESFEEMLIMYFEEKGFEYSKISISHTDVIYFDTHKEGINYTFKYVKDFTSQRVEQKDMSIMKNKSVDFDSMEGHEFEYFCADLLKKNGYEDVKVTQGSGDQGIDIIAYRDDIKCGIQCKCYSGDIGNKAVQEVFAGKTFYQCHVGIVLTNVSAL